MFITSSCYTQWMPYKLEDTAASGPYNGDKRVESVFRAAVPIQRFHDGTTDIVQSGCS